MKKSPKFFKYIITVFLLIVIVFSFSVYQSFQSVEKELTQDDLKVKELYKAKNNSNYDTNKTLENTTNKSNLGIEPEIEIEGQQKEDFLVLKTGTFDLGAKGSDRAHNGEGNISLIEFNGKNKIVTAENFRVTSGPAYELYLFEEAGIETKALFQSNRNKAHYIGDVKQFRGFQTFEIPENIDVEKIKSAVIWCEAFSVFITYADLKQ